MKKLYWYKFYAKYGPGHQCHAEEYIHYVYPIPRKAGYREDLFKNWCYEKSSDNAVGGILAISRVPKKVIMEELEKAKRFKKYYTELVVILKEEIK